MKQHEHKLFKMLKAKMDQVTRMMRHQVADTQRRQDEQARLHSAVVLQLDNLVEDIPAQLKRTRPETSTGDGPGPETSTAGETLK